MWRLGTRVIGLKALNMKNRLTPQLMALLEDVVQKRCPDLASSLSKAQSFEFTDDERRALLNATSAEFSATGLAPDDEPNQRGLSLEALLDYLNQNQIKAG